MMIRRTELDRVRAARLPPWLVMLATRRAMELAQQIHEELNSMPRVMAVGNGQVRDYATLKLRWSMIEWARSTIWQVGQAKTMQFKVDRAPLAEPALEVNKEKKWRPLSDPNIGALLGGLDHATILLARKKIRTNGGPSKLGGQKRGNED